MSFTKQTLTLCIAIALPIWAGESTTKKEPKAAGNTAESARPGILWVAPEDIRSRNLLYGSGGENRQPHGTVFTFEKEDLDGTNPKMDVRDDQGVKWKMKLGSEARPETVASRFVWAAGYFTTDDYLVENARIEELPSHLHRGRSMIGPNGEVHDVRLKRNPEGYEKDKDGAWQWKHSPLYGTREFNGLRVLMALVNNWDLKDVNNATFDKKSEKKSEKKSGDREGPEVIYYVSDLGASFGTTAIGPGHVERKGQFKWYERSRFITKETPTYVNLATPGRPFLLYFFNPKEYFMRVGEEWIGRRIPREDAKWIGGMLAQLSHEQICDAFRAGGYPPDEVKGFAAIVEKRIAALNDL